MGFHLASGALNQAALARDRARAAAGCWLLAACVFLAWMFTPAVGDQLLRAEIGYAGATALLALALTVLYRRGTGRSRRRAAASAAPERRDLQVGLARVARAEDRRARHEQARPGGGAARRGVAASMPPSTSIATSSPTTSRSARQLLQRVLDERLAAPARVDRHAQRELERARQLGQRARRGWRG